MSENLPVLRVAYSPDADDAFAVTARRIATVKQWVVMEAPTGQRFGVVRPQRDDFEDCAKRWD